MLNKKFLIIIIGLFISVGFVYLELPPSYYGGTIASDFKEWNYYYALFLDRNKREPMSFSELIHFIDEDASVKPGTFLREKTEIKTIENLNPQSLLVKYKKGPSWNQREFWCVYSFDENLASHKNKQKPYNVNSFCHYPSGKLGLRYNNEINGMDESQAETLLKHKNLDSSL